MVFGTKLRYIQCHRRVYETIIPEGVSINYHRATRGGYPSIYIVFFIAPAMVVIFYSPSGKYLRYIYAVPESIWFEVYLQRVCVDI